MCKYIFNKIRIKLLIAKIQDNIEQLWDLYDTIDDVEVQKRVLDEIDILERKVDKLI